MKCLNILIYKKEEINFFILFELRFFGIGGLLFILLDYV